MIPGRALWVASGWPVNLCNRKWVSSVYSLVGASSIFWLLFFSIMLFDIKTVHFESLFLIHLLLLLPPLPPFFSTLSMPCKIGFGLFSLSKHRLSISQSHFTNFSQTKLVLVRKNNRVSNVTRVVLCRTRFFHDFFTRIRYSGAFLSLFGQTCRSSVDTHTLWLSNLYFWTHLCPTFAFINDFNRILFPKFPSWPPLTRHTPFSIGRLTQSPTAFRTRLAVRHTGWPMARFWI